MTTADCAEDKSCRWCGSHHGPRCPEVKALEYADDGHVVRVEFMTPADYVAPVSAAQIHPHPFFQKPCISHSF